MLLVFLCEDDPQWRKRLETIATDYIAFADYDMKLALSTHSPTILLDYLDRQPTKAGIYILDVDLQHELSGIALAAKLRKKDALGKIIFITSHGDLAYLTFQHRLEALDYIIKDQPKEISKKLQKSLDFAWRRSQEDYPETSRFQIRTGSEVQNIPLEEIMFFVSHPSQPHKLILHRDNGRLEFYGSLSEVVASSPDFYRCHQSYVINTKNVKRVDKAAGIVEMANGETAIVTVRKMKTLLEAIAE